MQIMKNEPIRFEVIVFLITFANYSNVYTWRKKNTTC